MMSGDSVIEVLDASVKAYNYGRGAWPSSAPATRIACMEKFLDGLKVILLRTRFFCLILCYRKSAMKSYNC